MKVEWMVYGPDKTTDSGWCVLGKSPGIGGKQEKMFIAFCGDLPLPDQADVGHQIFFGMMRERQRWLCQAEYVGKDGFGREGAWVYYAFILPQKGGPAGIYELTKLLRKHCKNIDSNDRLDIEEPEIFHIEQPAPNLCQIFKESGQFVFAISDENIDRAGLVLDALVREFPSRHSSYIFPTNKVPSSFEMVGLLLDGAAEASALLPLRQQKISGRGAKVAVSASAIVAVLGMVFGLWGCASVHRYRSENERLRLQLNQVQSHASELSDKAKILRVSRSDEDEDFGKLIGARPRNVKIRIEIERLTSTFDNKSSEQILSTILDILEEIDRLDKTIRGVQPTSATEVD